MKTAAIDDPELIAALEAMAIVPMDLPVSLRGGANNRVYRVTTDAGDVVVKQYFRHRDDKRDRLAVEYSFLRFAQSCGVRCVPEAIAHSAAHSAACYSFLPGRQLAAGEVEVSHVQQAATFADELQRAARVDSLVELPDASEACFCIADHVKCVEGRVAKLRAIESGDDRLDRVRRFVSERLYPQWREVRERVLNRLRKDAGLDRVLATADRCVSPSDFGFHNARCDENGKLGFIDFEYAGWDDPAKLVCDFFCQPKVPVPSKYLQSWVELAASWTREPEVTAARVRLLLPVYRVKWCCIMLNVFLQPGRAQRHFAMGDAIAGSLNPLLDERLVAAEKMLSRIDEDQVVDHEPSDETSLAVPVVLSVSQSMKSSRRPV